MHFKEIMSRDSSIGIATGVDNRGSIPGSRKEIFLFSTASRPPLKTIQPPIQWIAGALPLGIEQPGRETDHSPPVSAEVKNVGAIPPLPHRAYLIKRRDNFTFTFYFKVIKWDDLHQLRI
jgi:hypothetical protein